MSDASVLDPPHSTPEPVAGTAMPPTPEASRQRFRRPRRGHRRWLPVTVLALLALFALLIPWLTPAPQADFAINLSPPSATHWAGTDHFGFDLLQRTAQGLRISLLIGAVSAVVSTLLGSAVGLLAAVWGGLVDRVLMRATDAVNAVPHLILAVVIVAMFKGSIAALIASIALTHWSQVARVVRSTVLSVRTSEYVASSYAAGASHGWVLSRHLAPAAFGQAVVAVVLMVPHAIWHESALSFLGLGLQPDQPSLGTLMDLARDDIMTGAWWTLVVPAVVLLATTLSVAALAPHDSPTQSRTLEVTG